MENQPLEQKKQESSQDTSSLRVQNKAPWPIRVIAVLMFLSGVSVILTSFFIFFFLPLLAAIFIVLAGFMIKYSVDIFKMKKKGYIGGMAVIACNVLISLAIIYIPNLNINIPGRKSLFSFIPTIITVAVLYYYREKFVD